MTINVNLNKVVTTTFIFLCTELEIAALVSKKRPEDEEEEERMDYSHSLHNRKSFADLVPAEYTSLEVGAF
jgi:hypothetical protein